MTTNHWQDVRIPVEEANQQRLSTLFKIAEVQGYHHSAVYGWAKRFADFPKPKGKLKRPGWTGAATMYSVPEVLAWMRTNLSLGYIQRPKNKN